MKNTMNIADMHCHILPGVDDGSRNMEQTLAMLKIAYDEGVRIIIATPHYHIGRMMADAKVVNERICQVKDIVAEKFPGLEIYGGQEIYYYSEAMDVLAEGKANTMAGSRYILMEYSVDESYDVISSSIYEAMTHGYVPIIAHIERYGCLMDRYDRVQELVESGAYLQVNASSVCGDNGRSIRHFIKKLLKKRLIHFVSSDAHSNRTRAPRFEQAASVLKKVCPPDYMVQLLWDNAVRVINDEEI